MGKLRRIKNAPTQPNPLPHDVSNAPTQPPSRNQPATQLATHGDIDMPKSSRRHLQNVAVVLYALGKVIKIIAQILNFTGKLLWITNSSHPSCLPTTKNNFLHNPAGFTLYNSLYNVYNCRPHLGRKPPIRVVFQQSELGTRDSSWKPAIRAVFQQSELTSNYPRWKPAIRAVFQQSGLRSRHPCAALHEISREVHPTSSAVLNVNGKKGCG